MKRQRDVIWDRRGRD